MRIRTVGSGTPDVAVVGSVHGDEPCGARAIERFVDSDLSVNRPVKLIVANEEALERNTRFVDVDLNRSLPGDPTSDLREERLAHRLWTEIDGCTTLGIHSTVSYADEIGAASNIDEEQRRLFEGMSLSKVVEMGPVSDGRCSSLPGFVDIEAGRQGTDQAAENAYQSILEFLTLTGVLDGSVDPSPTEYYEVYDPVYKDVGVEYRFVAENFERVGPGETYGYAGGDPLVADEEFWPVLMSDTGHDELFGYRARATDTTERWSTTAGRRRGSSRPTD